MKLFTTLIINCLQEPKTTEKINLLKVYFETENCNFLPITLHLVMALILSVLFRNDDSGVLRRWPYLIGLLMKVMKL